MDDLNYLFKRQQQERTSSARARSVPAKQAHEGLARLYEQRICELTEGRIVIGNASIELSSDPERTSTFGGTSSTGEPASPES